MVKVIAGVFLVLHGLVHLLYLGQSARLFELQPGMNWPNDSWAFAKLFGQDGTRMLANIACVLAAAGFVIGAAGIFFDQPWWRSVVVASAMFSAALYTFFWNGRFQHLANQGGVGILIDAAILVVVLIIL